jgi:hypothetical protein
MQHTPGPWEVGNVEDISADDEAPEWRAEVKCDGYEVAAGYGLTADEAEANARKIAALPELFKAVELAFGDISAFYGQRDNTKEPPAIDFGTVEAIWAAYEKARCNAR